VYGLWLRICTRYLALFVDNLFCVFLYIELGVLADGMDADVAAHPNKWYDGVIHVMQLNLPGESAQGTLPLLYLFGPLR
jgi:hypothetical protein